VEGRDYDTPPFGDMTLGGQVAALGINLVDAGQPRRALRSCRIGVELVGKVPYFEAGADAVAAILATTDAPLRQEERAELGSSPPEIRGTPDQSWSTFCVGWALAAVMEQGGDRSLRPVVGQWMQSFLNSCLTGNSGSCRESGGMPGLARGLRHRVESGASLTLDDVVAIPGGDCPRLLRRARDENLRVLMPSWTRACVKELTAIADSLARTAPDDRRAAGAMLYFDVVSRAVIAVPWDEAPAPVLQSALGTLTTETWRRGRRPDGCRWYVELVGRGLTTPELDGGARTAGCARPRGTVTVPALELIAYDGAVAKDSRALLAPVVELLWDWLHDMRNHSDRLDQLMTLPKELSGSKACRPFSIDASRRSMQWQTHVQSIADAAERGRFRIQITSAQPEKSPLGCPEVSGFKELGGGLLNAQGVLIWPTDARGMKRESALNILMYRGPDGGYRVTLAISQ
jgi:hypothetical protein